MWLFLFLLLIPTQLGRHFWPEWSYVLGIRVDYLSPVLYLLDLVWVGLVISNVKFPLSNIKKYFKIKYLAVLAFVFLNILIAASPMVALYKWLRVGQLIISFWYFRKNKKIIKEKLIKIIPCWIIFESLLAVAQIAKNGSLNGIFYWFGERSFTFNTIGIAQISVMGRGLIRAYGSFSHPNSLAGFLLVSLLLWVIFYDLLRPASYGRLKWWIVFWFGLLGIMVSGSRMVWLLTLGLFLSLSFVKIKNKSDTLGLFLMFLGIIVFVLSLVNMEYPIQSFLGGWDSDGIGKRVQLNLSGAKMIKESPWVGVGLGNFLVRLPEFQRNNGAYWLQPVHNIFILAWSQIGILGLSLLVLFFSKNFVWKKIDFIFKIIFMVIIVSGMIDHYWLTLPQNLWLLLLILSLSSS